MAGDSLPSAGQTFVVTQARSGFAGVWCHSVCRRAILGVDRICRGGREIHFCRRPGQQLSEKTADDGGQGAENDQSCGFMEG